MITTVTPNPSFDKTLRIGALTRGGVHRASEVTVEAAGKGVNVARAIAAAGGDAVAIVPGSVASTGEFAAVLAASTGELSLRVESVDTRTAIRTNVTVIEDDGVTTKFNESGEPFDADASAALLERALSEGAASTWIAVCGSHPPGFDPGFVAGLRDGLAASTRLAVDASGAGLEQAVAAAVDLVKPNLEELEALVGRGLPSVGAVVDAAQEVLARGVATVVVSLGGEGALLVDSDTVLRGRSGPAEVRNTVGAGDAFLAGFLSGGGAGHTGLTEALAWGHAAVESPTTAFAPASERHRTGVIVTEAIDPDEALADTGRGHG